MENGIPDEIQVLRVLYNTYKAYEHSNGFPSLYQPNFKGFN